MACIRRNRFQRALSLTRDKGARRYQVSDEADASQPRQSAIDRDGIPNVQEILYLISAERPCGAQEQPQNSILDRI